MKYAKFYIATTLLAVAMVSCQKDDLPTNDGAVASTPKENGSIDPNQYYFFGKDSVKGADVDRYLDQKNRKQQQNFTIANARYSGNNNSQRSLPVTQEAVSSDFLQYPHLRWDGFTPLNDRVGARQYFLTNNQGDVYNQINVNPGAPFADRGASRKVRGVGHVRAGYSFHQEGDWMRYIYTPEATRPKIPLTWNNAVTYNAIQVDLSPNDPSTLNGTVAGYLFLGQSPVISNTSGTTKTARSLAINSGGVGSNFRYYNGTMSSSTIKTESNYTETEINYSIGLDVSYGPLSGSAGGDRTLRYSTTSSSTQEYGVSTTISAFIPADVNIAPGRQCKFKVYYQPITSAYKHKIVSTLTGDLVGYRKKDSNSYGPEVIDPKLLLTPSDRQNGITNWLGVTVTNNSMFYTYICRNSSTNVVTWKSHDWVQWD